MDITYDPGKRDWTRRNRDLDFADAALVFAGRTFDVVDDRRNYGETRIITVGFLRGRMVIVGWTQRGATRHVFTMRKANAREQKKFGSRFATG